MSLRHKDNCRLTPKTGEISTRVEFWADYADLHPFIRRWIDITEYAKLVQFLRNIQGQRVHPHYHVLVRTGRTSCRKPNIQQVPRRGQIREIFVPSREHLFLSIDYSFIELRTLAAVCLQRYGRSVLAEVIKNGIDPHVNTAAMILGVEISDFMKLKDTDPKTFDQHRQKAKAINFGVPGGLGAESLADYAHSSYGVQMTLSEAQALRDKLTRQIYPELGRYLEENSMTTLARNLSCSEEQLWQALDFRGDRSPAIVGGVRNVLRGKRHRADGSPYDPAWYDRTWDSLIALNKNPDVYEGLAARRGSPSLCRQLFASSVGTLTGRIRGNVQYCQARNTPFQGLAADGAKLALFELIRQGFRVVAFIHDEFLIEVPVDADHDAIADEATRIMCSSMRQLTGEVPIACGDPVLMRRWSKDAQSMRNKDSRLCLSTW